MPLLAGIVLAAAEIYVIVVVAHLIGAALTVMALIASTIAGLWLLRVQGRRAWHSLRRAMEGGVLRDRELGDAALIFAGGALIAIPGFITGALGLVAVTPLTRPVVRRLLGAYMVRRGVAGHPAAAGARHAGPAGKQEPPGKVIRGHVITSDTAHADPAARPGPGSEQR